MRNGAQMKRQMEAMAVLGVAGRFKKTVLT